MSKPFSEVTRLVRQATVHLMVCNQNESPDGKFDGFISCGTGFFVSDDGWLLTCHHVVNGYNPEKQKIVAVFKANDTDITYATANAIAHSFEEIDLCAIKFDEVPSGVKPVQLSKAIPLQGSELGIFGYPDTWFNYDDQGQVRMDLLKPRVAKCVLARAEVMDFLKLKKRRLLETQFSFVKGNSGGPVFDAETGEVVGLVMGSQQAHQSAYDYAVIFRNDTEALTGEVLHPPPAPFSLKEGFSWKRVTSVTTVPYSYAVACDEIRASLGKHLTFL